MQDRRVLLRAADLVPVLGFSRSRVYQLLAQGTLPSVRIGRAIWIPAAALEQWLSNQKEQALGSVRVPGGGEELGDRSAS